MNRKKYQTEATCGSSTPKPKPPPAMPESEPTGGGESSKAEDAVEAVRLIVVKAILVVEGLRFIRDTKAYDPKFHSFREWCIANFGEKPGCLIDDNLGTPSRAKSL